MKDIKSYLINESIHVDIDDIDILEFTWKYDDYNKDDLDCLNSSEDELEDMLNSGESGEYAFEFSIDNFGTISGTIEVKCNWNRTKYDFDLSGSYIDDGNVEFWVNAMNTVLNHVIGYDLDACGAYKNFCNELKYII